MKLKTASLIVAIIGLSILLSVWAFNGFANDFNGFFNNGITPD